MFLSCNVYARDVDDVVVDAKSAARIFVTVYQQYGILGAADTVDKCYAESKNQYVCTYIDIGAKGIDDSAVRTMGFPQTQYFEDGATAARLDKAYDKLGLSKRDRASYIDAVGNIISKMINDELN